MKIDFEKLNDSDKIAYKASKTEFKSLIVNSNSGFKSGIRLV